MKERIINSTVIELRDGLQLSTPGGEYPQMADIHFDNGVFAKVEYQLSSRKNYTYADWMFLGKIAERIGQEVRMTANVPTKGGEKK